MLAGLKSKIRHYEGCLPKLAALDPEVFAAGMEMFPNPTGLALWMCTQQRSLGGRIPINVVRTKVGRDKVTNILRALHYGGYL